MQPDCPFETTLYDKDSYTTRMIKATPSTPFAWKIAIMHNSHCVHMVHEVI